MAEAGLNDTISHLYGYRLPKNPDDDEYNYFKGVLRSIIQHENIENDEKKKLNILVLIAGSNHYRHFENCSTFAEAMERLDERVNPQQGGNESLLSVDSSLSSANVSINPVDLLNSIGKLLISEASMEGSESKSSTPKVMSKPKVHKNRPRDTGIEDDSVDGNETCSESEEESDLEEESNIPDASERGPNETPGVKFLKLFKLQHLMTISKTKKKYFDSGSIKSLKKLFVDVFVLTPEIQFETREQAKNILAYLTNEMLEQICGKLQLKVVVRDGKDDLIKKILDELVKRGWIREN